MTKNAALTQTEAAQVAASDPAVCAWVSANAGAGKTHVLKMRVLRLLLAGTPPERLLCLTYTRAAAAEMSARVFADLAAWATAGEDTLAADLTGLLQRPPSTAEKSTARRLFARAIETPGGLKVQTIHAFCERLLQRFPLEAGVPARFTVLDEQTGRALQRDAVTAVLEAAVREPAGDLGRALATAVAFAADERFDDVIHEALTEHASLEAVARLARTAADGFGEAERTYRHIFRVRGEAACDGIDGDMAAVLDKDRIAAICAVLNGSIRPTDRKLAEKLAAALATERPAARIKTLAAVFMTTEGSPRQRLMTKEIAEENRDIGNLFKAAQTRFAGLDRERRALVLIEATLAVLRLAAAVGDRYRGAKTSRAALDFEDLIGRASDLLASVDAAQWVLYKLDGGLDHILVDEAQDTSPVQWSIVESLAVEFFSGAGARETARTLFAVGDEKQSIYSFQGAAPKMFADAGARFARLAAAVARPWKRVPLILSFRSVPSILDGVDSVFADPQRTPGVTTADSLRHVALRSGQAGMIEIWPLEVPVEVEPAEPWSPLEEIAVEPPAVRLAARIADTVSGWLQRGERLASEDRPIRPGDILILVRRRRPFAEPMVAALKTRGIAVAGADRMWITEQLAVQDLMALGDFLLLPEDDLALATVLKSPLFEFDDNDLLAIAPGREGSLWRALWEKSREAERFAAAVETLKQWRQQADALPPFEFYAGVLDTRDAAGRSARTRLLVRLGPEAADPIDEFLSRSLAYDENSPPSLQGFLAALRQAQPEIKRDMEHGRDEVRVMTVHGAKGLEAPIVFLPDTVWSSKNPASRKMLLKLSDRGWPVHFGEPLAWSVKGSGQLDPIDEAKEARQRADAEERDRLLYVAMTRARDRLYVAGFTGTKAPDPSCWYELIRSGLSERLVDATLPDGRQVRRLQTAQTRPCETPRGGTARVPSPQPLPEWAQRRAPPEPQLVVPLAPSRLAALAAAEAGEPAPSPQVLSEDNRLLRGSLTHALLEHLPKLPSKSWERAAAGFLVKRAAPLPHDVRASIAAEVLAILRDPAFAPVFGPHSRAEVALVAQISRPAGEGPDLQIAGRIDRLARLENEILIIDYKTNRPAPKTIEQVAPASLYQLAAYRLALSRLFGPIPVRAALVWTYGARLMRVPPAVLDDHQQRLWDLEKDRLR
ncbi:MAG: double-strand break repair helicase AddA [Hyphomicrobiaceae bacterium]